MAISYIDIFRPVPQDGVSQILSSAQNVLSGALNSAIQIGRDHASLQASQERDYLAERERNEVMKQRRVEFWQGQQNTDRAFKENVRRDVRDTEEENRDDVRDFSFKSRTDGRDAKLRADDVASLISSRADSRANEAENLTERREENRLRREDAAEKKDFSRRFGEEMFGPEKPKTLWERMFSGPVEPPAATVDEPEVMRKKANDARRIAIQTQNPQLYKQATDLDNAAYKKEAEKKFADVNAKLEAVAQAKEKASEKELVPAVNSIAIVLGTTAQNLLSADDATLKKLVEDPYPNIPSGTKAAWLETVVKLRQKRSGGAGSAPAVKSAAQKYLGL